MRHTRLPDGEDGRPQQSDAAVRDDAQLSDWQPGRGHSSGRDAVLADCAGEVRPEDGEQEHDTAPPGDDGRQSAGAAGAALRGERVRAAAGRLLCQVVAGQLL